MTPEVTVAIPTRDRLALLPGALATALGQVDVDLEVIVVDDCSSDGTEEYVRGIKDPRVRFFRQRTWQGVSAARNRGIAEARGEWLAFLDDDDRWHPQWLRFGVDAAREAGADFAYSDAVVIDEKGRTLEFAVAPPPDELPAKLCETSTITGPSAVIASAELLRRTGGFDTKISYVADWDMWLRFAAAGRGANCPGPWVEYLQHPGSMLLQRGFDIPGEFEYLRAKHPDVTLEPSAFELWLVRRYREERKRFRASRVYLHAALRHRHPSWLLRAVAVIFGERVMKLGKSARRRLRRRGLEATGWERTPSGTDRSQRS